MEKVRLVFVTTFFSLFLGFVSAQIAFACSPTISVLSTKGDGAYATCKNTGEDENYCYYDCTCTGTEQRCNELYAAAGLEDV